VARVSTKRNVLVFDGGKMKERGRLKSKAYKE
jgi:hypothetical protein